MIYFVLNLPSFCLRVLIELNPIIFPTWYAKSPALSNQGGYFDHNSAYFSSHTMSKKPYWKITSNFDFKEFWFDARERERANSIMSKGWKMLLMNFCELDKYLPVQTVIIFVPIFYTKGLLINMFNIFAGIVRFMWSFGECIWYCKCSIQCNHCGRYTVTRLPPIIHISIFHISHFTCYLNFALFMFWDWRKIF